MKGKLVLIIGPSGSGKSSLIARVRAQHPEFVYPMSCKTRAPRPGERDGVAYHFLSDEEFDARIAEGAFLEWASYGGHRYGTLAADVLEPLKEGHIIIKEVEIQGARSILEQLPRENIIIVFIDAGPWNELEERIKKRAQVGEPELALRRQRYEEESAFAPQADYVVSNTAEGIEAAGAQLDDVINEVVRSVEDS